jgi:hypothetical protein
MRIGGQMRWSFACVAVLAVGAAVMDGAAPAADRTQVLPNAHAHNDYHHKRPLQDALDHGFASIEADVYLIDGQLLVGHDLWELSPNRTLKSLYLEPLRQRVKDNNGSVYGDGSEVTLLVDFKSDAPATYALLTKQLAEYADMFTRVVDGKSQRGPIQVVISGNRPIDQVAAERTRYASIDGRFPDLDGPHSADSVPLVSENWRSHFKWNGRGEMPAAEREKLHDLAARCHSQNRRLRFWATPETPECWSELLAAHVDLIGTDNLAALREFLAARPAL